MNYGEALDCFNEVFKIDPYHNKALNNRGSMYYQMQNVDEALKRFKIDSAADTNLIEAESQAMEINSI